MIKEIVNKWFKCWEDGNYSQVPIEEEFKHTSPFGTIEGKQKYLDLVRENEDKFLGYKFKIHDTIYENEKASVRYTATQGKEFSLDVSEWYYFKNNLISEIISYYHIGEIREERKLS